MIFDKNGQKSSYSGELGNCVYVLSVGDKLRVYETDRAADPGIYIAPEQFGALLAGLLTGELVTQQDDHVCISADSIEGASGKVITSQKNFDLFMVDVRAGKFDHWCELAVATAG